MKTLIAIFCLVSGLAFGSSPVGTLGTIPTLDIGGRIFTDLTNLIVLQAQNTTTSHWGTFRKPNSTSGYQVTSGKTLHILGAQSSIIVDGGAGGNATVLYGDTDVGIDSASAPTNPIYPYGTVAVSISGSIPLNLAPGVYPQSLNFDVPATKYPALYVPAGTGQQVQITIYGYEQ